MKSKERIQKIIGRVKKRTFAGVVCEQEVYTISPRGQKTTASEPRLRFNNETERAAHREGISRRKHARIINENFRPGDLYLTLTFNDKYECGSAAECWTLLKRFIRRIRRKYPNVKLAYYYGKGENETKRYHVHMLAAGISEHALISKWGYGKVKRVKKLWAHVFYDDVDHGPDYTSLANYLFDHWDPEQGPHRYHHTQKLKQPEEEEKVCRRKYSELNPPEAPEGYLLVETKSTKYGYLYFKYIKKPGHRFLDFDANIPKPKRSRKRRQKQGATG